ncbi:MAG: hypothetical protein PWR01_4592 [Clostridiales bacterium]|nr:hypothetical protein [Clostridiales bacterium]MDN5283519.1 hypothetical protein [Candidatus Ozemobacter sp.]
MRSSGFVLWHFGFSWLFLLYFCFVSFACLAERNVGISSTGGNSNSQMTIYSDPGKDSQGRDKGFSPRDLFGPGPTTTKKPVREKNEQSYHIEFSGEGEGLEGVSMENLRFIPDDAPAKTNLPKTTTSSPVKSKSSKSTARNVKRTTTSKKPIQKKKREMTEDEFRKSIGMEPQTETEKIVEAAAKGLLILGSLGLLGYALAPAKAAAVAKAGLAAKSAAASADSVLSSEVYDATGSDSDFLESEEGYITEEQVELPQEPKVGETRSYTDENGTRWTEVYNGQNWIDAASNNAAIDQVADNRVWQEQQRIKQLNHDTAFDRQLEQQRVKHQARLEEIHARNKAEIRENSKIILESDQLMQEMAERALEKVEKVNRVLDSGKTLVDVAVPVVGAFSGPPGWVVGTGYTVLSEAGAGAGTALADSSKSILVETAKGVGKGVVNVVIAEGLNSALAIGSKVLRAGANTIPTGNSFKVSYSQTKFNAPVPTEEMGQMFNNLTHGKNLTGGVDSDMAFSTLSNVGKSFFGGGKGLMSEAGSQLAQDSIGKLANGTFASAKGNLVDANIGNFANSNLWGKG